MSYTAGPAWTPVPAYGACRHQLGLSRVHRHPATAFPGAPLPSDLLSSLSHPCLGLLGWLPDLCPLASGHSSSKSPPQGHPSIFLLSSPHIPGWVHSSVQPSTCGSRPGCRCWGRCLHCVPGPLCCPSPCHLLAFHFCCTWNTSTPNTHTRTPQSAGFSPPP